MCQWNQAFCQLFTKIGLWRSSLFLKQIRCGCVARGRSSWSFDPQQSYGCCRLCHFSTSCSPLLNIHFALCKRFLALSNILPLSTWNSRWLVCGSCTPSLRRRHSQQHHPTKIIHSSLVVLHQHLPLVFGEEKRVHPWMLPWRKRPPHHHQYPLEIWSCCRFEEEQHWRIWLHSMRRVGPRPMFMATGLNLELMTKERRIWLNRYVWAWAKSNTIVMKNEHAASWTKPYIKSLIFGYIPSSLNGLFDLTCFDLKWQ